MTKNLVPPFSRITDFHACGPLEVRFRRREFGVAHAE